MSMNFSGILGKRANHINKHPLFKETQLMMKMTKKLIRIMTTMIVIQLIQKMMVV